MEYKKWPKKLLGYDFDIVYKPEETLVTGSSLLAIAVLSVLQLQELYNEITEDEELQRLRDLVQKSQLSNLHYTIRNDKLWYMNRLVIPKQSASILLILFECYDGKTEGHSSVLRTVKRVQTMFHWEGLFKTVQKYVDERGICQTQKYSTLSPAGLLLPLPIPQRVWEDVSMDFIEGLPTSQGINVIMVIVDRLSKYAHFVGAATLIYSN
ncbi:hypothetical protein N665_0060s0008 [Sinapis alba]|nr:hypothetical protein N665_0060s0008 [Sinapis alba]